MAYVISSSCIGRELPKSCVVAGGFPCVEACPVDGIFSLAGDSQMYVDPLECIDCGACEAACPLTAGVFVDYDNPAAAAANARYYHHPLTTAKPAQSRPAGY
jgi:Fe-S-cluster-containing hydrogenase component 2